MGWTQASFFVKEALSIYMGGRLCPRLYDGFVRKSERHMT